MRVLIAIPNLSLGGAEKMSAAQAVGLSQKGFDVTLLTVYKAQDFYEVPAGIKRIALDLEPEKKNLPGKFKSFRALYKIFKEVKPGAVISNMMVNVAALAILMKIKTIFAEHMQLDKTDLTIQKKFVLNRAAYCVFLSEKDVRYFKQHRFKSIPLVIHNPAVKPPADGVKPGFLKPSKNAVAAGRLVYEKGFDILIRAWTAVAKKHPDWHLSIVGDGPLKDVLAAQIKKLKMEKNITLAGAQKNMGDVYNNADIFILSSRSEGFPLALCEAMACGAAPAAFDCENGPAEIIQKNADGILLEEETAAELSAGVNYLIEHEDKRKLFAENAAKITARFTPEDYLEKYAALLK